jgi:hypothetical protein
MAAAAQQSLVKQYCAGCHSAAAKSGGFTFESLDLTHPDRTAETAEKVIRKLRTGMMPPAGAPRPSRAALDSFAASIENAVDLTAAGNPNPGRPGLHRLNRAEYENSVRDLLHLNVSAEDLLPADDMSHGFDNIADVLTISPTLMDAYIRAAGKVARLAVGDATAPPVVETYHLGQSYSQLRHVEGTPIGTRGGLAVTHNFPADGEYIFRTTLHFTNNTFLFGSTMKGEQLEVAINGQRVALFDINPLMKTEEDLRTGPIKVKAGPQVVSAAFIPKANGPMQDFVMPYERILGNNFRGQDPGLTSPPHVRDFGINGPYRITGVSETPSREKIFVCRPDAKGDDEVRCAKKILTALARQGYRRPPTDADLEELMTV